MRRWATWLVSVAIMGAVAYFFRDRLSALDPSTVLHAHPGPLLLAIAFTGLALFAMAEVMYLLLSSEESRITRRSAAALTLASNAWSTALPGGPAFAAVLTFQVHRRWGTSVLRSSWFIVLSSALSTMWLIMLGVFAVLFLEADFHLFSLALVLALTGGLAAGLWWCLRHPAAVESAVRRIMPRVNWVLRREPQRDVDKLIGLVAQFDEVHITLGRFTTTAIWSLLNWLAEAAALWACVWAITRQAPTFGPSGVDQTTVAGVLLAFVTSKIAGSVQVTPGGLGPVEATLIATMVATGLTAADATGTVIVYRLISLFLVTAIGWVVYFVAFARHGISAREGTPNQLKE